MNRFFNKKKTLVTLLTVLVLVFALTACSQATLIIKIADVFAWLEKDAGLPISKVDAGEEYYLPAAYSVYPDISLQWSKSDEQVLIKDGEGTKIDSPISISEQTIKRDNLDYYVMTVNDVVSYTTITIKANIIVSSAQSGSSSGRSDDGAVIVLEGDPQASWTRTYKVVPEGAEPEDVVNCFATIYEVLGIDNENKLVASGKLGLMNSIFGNTVVWSSNKPEVIATDGTFTKPGYNTAVTLTARITYGGTVYAREINAAAMGYATIPSQSQLEAYLASVIPDNINADISLPANYNDPILMQALAGVSPDKWADIPYRVISITYTPDKPTLVVGGKIVRGTPAQDIDLHIAAAFAIGESVFATADINSKIAKMTLSEIEEELTADMQGIIPAYIEVGESLATTITTHNLPIEWYIDEEWNQEGFISVDTDGKLTKNNDYFEITKQTTIKAKISLGEDNRVYTYTTTLLFSQSQIDFADNNLEAALKEILGVAADNRITLASFMNYDSDTLDLSNKGISNLKGLEYALNITKLDLSGNQLQSLSYLNQNITWLQWLDVSNNLISNIEGQAGSLVNLTYLNLNGNNPNGAKISNIADIATITGLKELYLDGLAISNISPLSELTALVRLSLKDNEITAVSNLSQLTNLVYLNLESNTLQSLTGIGGFVKLQELYLKDNYNTTAFNLNILSSMSSLRVLTLSNNGVSNTQVFQQLKALTHLELANTGFSDISHLVFEEGGNTTSNLTYLDISNDSTGRYINNVTNQSNLYDIYRLQYLYAANIGITDIAWAASLSDIQVLDLSNSDFTGVLNFEVLYGKTHLIELRISGKEYFEINNLHRINGNEIGSGALEYLQVLDITNGKVLAGFGQLTRLEDLEQLYANNCGLDDDDLVVLGNYKKLKVLDIGNNNITSITASLLATDSQDIKLGGTIEQLNIDGTDIDTAFLMDMSVLTDISVIGNTKNLTKSNLYTYYTLVQEGKRVYYDSAAVWQPSTTVLQAIANDILDDIDFSSDAITQAFVTGNGLALPSNIYGFDIVWGTTDSAYTVVLIDGIYYLQVSTLKRAGMESSVNMDNGIVPIYAEISMPDLAEYTFVNNTFYADWSAMERVTAFDGNGGGATSSITRYQGIQIIAPIGPSRTGYTFASWHTQANLENGEAYPFGAIADITLYARWSANSYTVTYIPNIPTGASTADLFVLVDNEGNSVTQNTVIYDAPYALHTPVLPGYTFDGWFDNDTQYPGGIWTTPQDITVTAHWHANTYIVCFDTARPNDDDITELTFLHDYDYSTELDSDGDEIGYYTGVTFDTDFTLATPFVNDDLYYFWGWYNFDSSRQDIAPEDIVVELTDYTGEDTWRYIAGADNAIVRVYAWWLKRIDKPVPIANIVYDGTAKNAVPENIGYTISQNHIHPGYYTTIVELNKNCVWTGRTFEGLSFDWSIAKADYDISEIALNGAEFTYDGTTRAIAINGVLPTGADGIQVAVSYTINGVSGNSEANAGNHTIIASFSSASTNYNEIILTLTAILKINKADYDLSNITFEGAAYPYDDTAKTLLVSGILPIGADSVQPSVSYTINGATGNSAIKEGLYTIIAYITGSSNYNTVSLSATLIIGMPISSISDFDIIRNNLLGYYYLTNDINLNNAEWAPIGTGSGANAFSGTFYGNGYAISNFKVTIGALYVGFFGYNTGEIANLGLTDFYIDVSYSGTIYAGGLVGRNYEGTITNCYTTGDVSASSSDAYVGGLVGRNSGTIADCYATGDISATSNSSYAYAGGLVGYNYTNGTIMGCYAMGDVNATSSSSYAYAGGLVGYNYTNGTITGCYAKGDIRAESNSYSAYAGGLVGYNGNGTIAGCYATGDVSASGETGVKHAGGLVGCNNNGTITNCYATGDISATGSSSAYAGGLVGSNNYDTITGCYCYEGQIFYRKEGSEEYFTPSNTTGTATALTNLQSEQWIIANLWGYDADLWQFNQGIFPVFKENMVEILNIIIEINTAEELLKLSGKSSVRNYILMDNINLNGIEWIPLKHFVGIFDGNDYTISNFKITTGAQYIGFFGYNTGEIKNLGLTNFSIEAGYSNTIYAGGLVGYNYSSGTITNCYATGAVNAESSLGSAYAGGLVGYNNSGTIAGCFATGDISATSSPSSAYAGGLVGYSGDTIRGCYCYEGQTFYRKEGENEYTTPSNTTELAASLTNLQSEQWIIDNLWGYDTEFWIFAEGSFPVLKENSADILNSIVEINTAEELLKLSGKSSVRNYILMSDINLNGVEWISIRCFSGAFDGNGYTISNFKITTGAQYIGFFGYNAGIIKNLGLIGFYIDVTYSSTIYVGGLVGRNEGTITDCYATGEVSATSDSYSAYAGGLVGYSTGAITGCYATGDVNAESSSASAYAGGLVGGNSGSSAKISNCYATGDVSAVYTGTSNSDSAYAGGLVGYNSGTITGCYATGEVSASRTGKSSAPLLPSSSATAGGLVGYNSGTITGCYATGSVSAATSFILYSAYAGGLVGYNNGGTISNCYRYEGQTFYRKQGSTEYTTPSNTTGTATSLANLQLGVWVKANLGWGEYVSPQDLVINPGNVWIFVSNDYPQLYHQN